MRSYTVHVPPGAGATDQSKPEATIETSEKLVLAADGFSLFAFLLAPIWMLVNRCWIALIVYIVTMLALELGTEALGMHLLWSTLIALGVHLIIGFEADEILRWSLNRRGFKAVAVVSGRDADEAEVRFLDHLVRPETNIRRSQSPLAQPPVPQSSTHPAPEDINFPGTPTALGTN